MLDASSRAQKKKFSYMTGISMAHNYYAVRSRLLRAEQGLQQQMGSIAYICSWGICKLNLVLLAGYSRRVNRRTAESFRVSREAI